MFCVSQDIEKSDKKIGVRVLLKSMKFYAGIRCNIYLKNIMVPCLQSVTEKKTEKHSPFLRAVSSILSK